MCVVSATFDSFKTIPLEQWTRPAFNEALEILERLKALDIKLGQKDCEDIQKAEILKKIDERLTKLEQAQKRKKKGRKNGTTKGR